MADERRAGKPWLARIARVLGWRRRKTGRDPAADPALRLERLRAIARLPARKRWRHEERLLSALSDGDPTVRAEARRAIRFACTFDELDARLRSGPAPAAACELMGALQHDAVVEVLFALAGHAEEAPLRDAAVRGLRHQRAADVVPAAVEALDDEQPGVRQAAETVLCALGEPAVSLLVSALSAPRWRVRLGAVRALEIIGGDRAADALAGATRDPSDEVRAEAVRVLAALRPGAADEGIITCLSDPSVAVRIGAATALAHSDTAQAAAHLARFLRSCAADPTFEVADQEFLAAVARMKSLPQDIVSSVLAAPNQSLAVSLALALEEAGVLDAWLGDLPAATPRYARRLKDLLRAAAALGAREPFLRALEAPSAAVRAFSAHAVGECRYEEGLPGLHLLLNDEDDNVRRTALAAVMRIEPSLGMEAAIEALRDPSHQVRGAAVSALAGAVSQGALGSASQRALPPAGETAGSPHVTYGLPMAVSQALGKLALRADPDAAPGRKDAVLSAAAAVGHSLHDPSPQVRARAARALGEVGASASAQALVERTLHDEDANVRAACAEAIGRSPGSDTSEALCRALREGHAEMRRRAADALERVSDRATAPSLLHALQDSDAEVRRLAARALWTMADTAMGEILLEHLHSPDPAVRAAVAGLLGKVQAPYALEPVANRLQDPHPRVRAAAANALAAMGEMAQPALPRLAAALGDSDAFVRARAADAMSRIGAAAAAHLPALLDAMGDEDQAVREAARCCAAGLAGQGALAPFVDALRDDDRRDRVRRVLMHVDLSVMRILLRMAREVNSTAGERLLDIVAEALRQRGSLEECSKDLLSLDPTVRLSGLEALALISTPEAVALIAQAMQNDPLPSLRERAAEILQTLQRPAPAPNVADIAPTRANLPPSGGTG